MTENEKKNLLNVLNKASEFPASNERKMASLVASVPADADDEVQPDGSRLISWLQDAAMFQLLWLAPEGRICANRTNPFTRRSEGFEASYGTGTKK